MAEDIAKPDEKKSSKKLIIIIVAVLVLLAAGGGGYYFFMQGDGASDKDNVSEEADKESEAPVVDNVYFDLTQPLVVNFPKGSGVSLVQVSVSFLVNGDDGVAALKKHEPMVRNNLMMKINAQSPAAMKSKEGKDELRAAILTEVNAIFSKVAPGSSVKEVFFTTFVMQ